MLAGSGQRAAAQDSAPVDQVQAVVFGLDTPQEALRADQHLGHIPGVLLTRTDVRTRNLYMLVKAESPDQEQAVRAALGQLGLRLACWTRAPRSDGPFDHLDPDRCGETPSVR